MTQADNMPLPVDGELRRCARRAGPLAYYVRGDGPPVLLVHSINAAASAHEVRPVFDHLCTRFTTYAVDLPGFGRSDRSKRDYDVRLYTDAILDLADIIREETGQSPAAVLGLSLSAEFVTRAVVERQVAHRVVLVNPTGFNHGANDLKQEGGTRELPGFEGFLSLPGLGKGLFSLLTKPGMVRYFLRRTFGSDNVDPWLVDYSAMTARQPGARHAAFAFLSGKLFSKDIRALYERLECPVWLAHGTRGDFDDFSEAQWTSDRPNWARTAYDSGAMVFFEEPEAFHRDLDAFLSERGEQDHP